MKVVKSSDEVESQAESLAAVAVGASQQAEPLEPADDMFSHNAFARHLLVFLLLFGRKGTMLALFVRGATGAAAAIMLLDALIATIAGAAGELLQRQAAFLEEGEVVQLAFGKGGRQQTTAAGLD